MKCHREGKGLELKTGSPGASRIHTYSLFNKNVLSASREPGKGLGPVILWCVRPSCPSGAYIFREERWVRKKTTIIQFQEEVLVVKKMKVERSPGSTGSGIGSDCFRGSGQGRVS